MIIACHFQGPGCINTSTREAWVCRYNNEWACFFVCDVCFSYLETTSVVILANQPADIWIREMYDRICGGFNEE